MHYDSEAQRRPLLQQLVAEGQLPDVAYATDDHVGVWYEGVDAIRVVADTLVSPVDVPAAYVLTREESTDLERRVGVGERF